MSHKDLLLEKGIGKTYIEKLSSKYKVFLKSNEIKDPYSYEAIEDFSVWLIMQVYATSSASSWRIYRNAFKKICEFSELHVHVDNASTFVTQVKTKNVGRKRKRYLDVAVMRKLLSAINSSSSKYKQVIIDWIKATEMVGLRPNEWEHSTIFTPDGHIPVLKAYNTKKSVESKRNLAEFRFIPLSHLDEYQVDIISNFMSKFKALIKIHGYDKAFDYLRCTLKYYVDLTCTYSETATSGMSIYSARDQFCLNMRASLDDPELISYFMGHTDVERQKRSYGNITHGKKTPTPIDARGFLARNNLHKFE
jgi:hypothetical protein